MQLLKKAHIRVLAVIAEHTRDGGIALGDVPASILSAYQKNAETKVIESILAAKEMIFFVIQAPESGKWVCTPEGLQEYSRIRTNQNWLLDPTTSPKLPMRA